MNWLSTGSPMITDIPRSALALIEYITSGDNQTKWAIIIAMTAILKWEGITLESLHSEHSRPLITAIHRSLHQWRMEDYIQNILDNPLSIELDPIIREIFVGKFLLDSSVIEENIKWDTAKILSPEEK